MKQVIVWTISVLLMNGVSPAVAQQSKGVGAAFGSRDPRTCLSRKEPVKGNMSAEQAKQYFVCDTERVWESGNKFLTLVTEVKLEIGKSRPFNRSTDGFQNSDIDPTVVVYPIRGSFVKWQCSPLGEFNVVRGKSCTKWEQPNAQGTCWTDTFGEWHCNMMDTRGPEGVGYQPPPAGN